MQQLIFEAAWDKTIAPIDRDNITSLFRKTTNENKENVEIIPIRQAINHNEDLLVIVLIHNFSNEDFPLRNVYASYLEADELIAEHDFTFPQVNIQRKTSMPWTFIFPKVSWHRSPSFENSRLQIEKEKKTLQTGKSLQ